MSKLIDNIDYMFVVFGTALGLQQIETVLGIILIILQVITLGYKLGLKLYKRIHNKEFDQIADDLDAACNFLEDKVKGGKE